jgi:hypothetical protein
MIIYKIVVIKKYMCRPVMMVDYARIWHKFVLRTHYMILLGMHSVHKNNVLVLDTSYTEQCFRGRSDEFRTHCKHCNMTHCDTHQWNMFLPLIPLTFCNYSLLYRVFIVYLQDYTNKYIYQFFNIMSKLYYIIIYFMQNLL